MNKIEKGFTILETMAVMTIVIILIAAGIPSYVTFQKNNQASSISAALNASIRLARAESLKRGTGVKICNATVDTNGQINGCNTTRSDWEYGWRVMTNDTDAEIIQVYSMPSNTVVRATATTVLFDPTGLPDHTYAFTISPTGCTQGRHLYLNISGSLDVETIKCPE